jgi:signal transduction histidine kinase
MRLPIGRLSGWPRDLVPALALATAGALEVAANPVIAPRAAAYPCEIAMGLALAARRRAPLTTLILVTATATTQALAGVPMDRPWVPLAATLTAAYALASRTPIDRTATGFVIAVLGFAVQAIDQHKGFGNVLFGIAFAAPIFAAGATVRARTQRAVAREREHQEDARAAVEAERRRIARDLHDVISHSLGIVVLQAGAAEQVVASDPDKARELLVGIRTVGQQAVAELGALLTLARSAPAESLEPAPTLDDVDQLAAAMSRSGLHVTIESRGVRRPLPAALEMSAYRIIQEALTNAAKHSDGTRAVVTLNHDPINLAIEVVDDGTGAASAAPGTRSGLVGMHERAAVFGGRIEAGPSPTGGWRVEATLPVPR